MKSIEYNLEIIGEKKSYSPRKEIINPIINSNKKIFEITADNSYGKTFFLNLLAYGLDADKLDDTKILNSIKESISRYDDKSSYSLEYNINLDLSDSRVLRLSKQKGRDKLIQINDGAPISYKTLHNELSIIYDVPSNPSERLNAVIKDLNNWNSNLKNKLEKVTRHFFELTKEFDSVRNEAKIIFLKETIDKLEIDIEKKKELIENEKKTIKDLKVLKNLNSLITLTRKNDETEFAILKKEKELKQLPKPIKVDKKDTHLIKKLNDELVEIENKFKKIIAQFIGNINDESEILEIIYEDSNINKHYNRIKETILRDLHENSSDYVLKQAKYIESIDYLKDTILRFIDKKKNDKSYIIHNSYSQLVCLLEELIENNIDYLLKDATDLDSKKLKSQLQELVSTYKIKNYDYLKAFLNTELRLIKGYITQFARTNNQLNIENKKKLVDDDDNIYYKVKAELDNLKNSLKTVKSSLSITSGNCATDLDISDLSMINTIQKITDRKFNYEKRISDNNLLANLNLSVEEIQLKIKRLEKSCQDLVDDNAMNKMAFKIEDDRKPSKYNSEQKKAIHTFDRMLKQILSNLKHYDELISKIETDKLTEFRHEKDIKFMELAGKIIAYSMDNKLLQSDGKFIALNFYDMIKQEFHCENDIIIKKLDVSTGLASANYLKQRIDNVEGKYVVVLLDEIGNMAQNALDTVIESIKKLDSQNRLVIAMLTRPNSNGIQIIEY
jgi:hypothetical protein